MKKTVVAWVFLCLEESILYACMMRHVFLSGLKVLFVWELKSLLVLLERNFLCEKMINAFSLWSPAVEVKRFESEILWFFLLYCLIQSHLEDFKRNPRVYKMGYYHQQVTLTTTYLFVRAVNIQELSWMAQWLFCFLSFIS